jgi:DNA-binding MarR family transcriptional regulator
VRETDPADGRAARLRLGDEAQQRVEAWRDQRVSYLADAVAALDDDDRERLDAAIPAIRRLVEVLG